MNIKLALLTVILLAMAATASAAAYEQRINSLGTSGTVEIKTDSVDITIVRTSGNTMEVELSGSGRSRYNLSVDESRGDVSIEVKRKQQWLFRVFQRTDASLTVSIPSGWTRGDLSVSSVSGSLTVDQNLAGRRLSLGTVSGSVKLQDAIATDHLDIKSVSGSISGNKLESPTVTIDTVSGSVHLEELATSTDGTADINSVSGSIAIDRLLAMTAAARSLSGSIDCKINPSFSGKIVAKTVSGNVRNDISHIDRETVDGKTSTWWIGNGNGLLEFSSTSGRVKLDN